MKALPSIAFNEFRGTAGEVTARRIGGATVLNGRAQHSHVKSPKQSEHRAHFSYITKQFRLLTSEQQAAWACLASQHREHALIGGGEPLTAFNLFVCLNANRALLGVAPTYEAPSYIHGSSYIAFDDIWLAPSRFMISGLRDPENKNARLVVRIASTASNGVTKLWGQTVVLGKFHESDWGDVQLTEAYLDQFGVPIVVGQKYFIELYWMDEYSGYVSEISRVCYPAVDDLSIHGNQYVPRKRITQSDVVENERNSVTDLKVEYTSGSPLLSVEAQLEGYSNVAASYIYLNKEIPLPEGTGQLCCWALARGTDTFSAQSYEITINRPSRYSDASMTFAHRGGKYAKPTDIIGGGLLY